ncbi:MAG: hypothetical protein K2X01_04900 [Cyanobacteria bacterium]|nr:hypothetical protein [Cyanobacteriota bacterium]
MGLEHVSREAKLMAAKDIVASCIKGSGETVSAEYVCQLLSKVYGTIQEIAPDPSERKIGLG